MIPLLVCHLSLIAVLVLLITAILYYILEVSFVPQAVTALSFPQQSNGATLAQTPCSTTVNKELPPLYSATSPLKLLMLVVDTTVAYKQVVVAVIVCAWNERSIQ